MDFSTDKDRLVERFDTAFSKSAYPGDGNLVDRSDVPEAIAVERYFAGRRDWRNLGAASIDIDGALSFFSDSAFRFYLPAFMIADVREELICNDPTVRLCWPLTPQSENERIAEVWGGGTIGERARTCFAHFTDEQRAAIVTYLAWRLAKDVYNPTIEQALQNYWLPETNR